MEPPSLQTGLELLRSHLPRLPEGAGVYRMLNADGDVLYVGKARNLKRRVTSYTQPNRLTNRLQRMVAETRQLEITTTASEVEALLLESSYIKKLEPRYNVLLRDDKSYPHIFISTEHDFPQISKHRGARKRKGQYFGPFASVTAVNTMITELQKAFRLRNCSDATFASRTRPCLQYHIKRCSAPCVDKISAEDYGRSVEEACQTLVGKSNTVKKTYTQAMEHASDALDFETAAMWRDRIRALTQLQAHQSVHATSITEADVLALFTIGGQSCLHVSFFRNGQNYGDTGAFLRHEEGLPLAEIMQTALLQFYEKHTPPKLLLLSTAPTERSLLTQALQQRVEGKLRLEVPKQGAKKDLIEHGLRNAEQNLKRRLSEGRAEQALLEACATTFTLPAPPQRIEIYDNSHTGGNQAQGAMVVYTARDGLDKKSYRRFNIRSQELAAGDDYGMLREVLQRRFSRALKEDPDRSGDGWPELVLVDGGAGQLSSAQDVMADLGLDDIPLVGIAKGPDRNAGRERFFMPDRKPFSLPPRDSLLYFLQRLRDEAHRFAIGGHRKKRSKDSLKSQLDDIPNVGAARRRALLHHFGDARAIARAGVKDMMQVEGISQALAQQIYDYFNPGG